MKALLLLSILFVASIFAENVQWIQKGRADDDTVVPFRLALKQRNTLELENVLLDVSDPQSPNYGNHWKIDDILDFVAPAKDVSEGVVKYLLKKGVTKVENRRDIVLGEAKVKLIEKLFDTKLYVFKHSTQKKHIVRAVGSHKIPHKIQDAVDFVVGLYEFPQLRKQKIAPKQSDAGKGLGYVIPQLIQTAYSIPTDYAVSSNSSLCLAEFQADQSYSEKDLKTFAQGVNMPLIKVPHKVGPFSGQDPDAESTLDVEYGGAIALNNTDWFWTVNGWMMEFATDLFSTDPAPYVVSMSWGWPEPSQCQVGKCNDGETSVQYVSRVNTEFVKIGLRGITLLAASGDQGAPGDGNQYCNGKHPLSTIFPGASPWVLSVGATMLINGSSNAPTLGAQPPICDKYKCATTTDEGVCTYPKALITTGGGFSDFSSTPSWQAKAVQGYLNSGIELPPSGAFNRSNRGFPDVSALGHNYLIALSGDWSGVDGTSCSSPVFGGIIALLNDWRLLNGKSSLGYVNPLMYQAAAANPNTFKDILTGNNKCTENCCSKIGYLATKGWDPVTGLGTPHFPSLLKFVQSLK